jgi:hypothetical protein
MPFTIAASPGMVLTFELSTGQDLLKMVLTFELAQVIITKFQE